jgi:hypothetical protein
MSKNSDKKPSYISPELRIDLMKYLIEADKRGDLDLTEKRRREIALYSDI